jgi:hypothetical protein
MHSFDDSIWIAFCADSIDWVIARAKFFVITNLSFTTYTLLRSLPFTPYCLRMSMVFCSYSTLFRSLLMANVYFVNSKSVPFFSLNDSIIITTPKGDFISAKNLTCSMLRLSILFPHMINPIGVLKLFSNIFASFMNLLSPFSSRLFTI